MATYRAQGWREQADGSHVLTCPNGKEYRLRKEGRAWLLTTPYGNEYPVEEGINAAKDSAELRAASDGDLRAGDLKRG